MGFLETLPAPLTARSKRFLAVWHGWRGSRLLPERGDIDRAALGDLAGTCLLLNVRGHDDINIDWVGDEITRQIGVDLAGCNYLDLTSRANRAWRAHLTLAQMAQPCSVAIYYWLRLGSGDTLPVEFVSGPLREDGASHASLILCCASGLTGSEAEPVAVDPDSYQEGDGMRFIDIGAGMPPMIPAQRQEARPVQ
ncbi:PAS domain-containing protein [Ferrovibrio sp.]|uniref:PAS domain-containing protein n=1 Tax=Ferrovibrio sp. TaxID=1917215 RepID=UPI00351273F2